MRVAVMAKRQQQDFDVDGREAGRRARWRRSGTAGPRRRRRRERRASPAGPARARGRETARRAIRLRNSAFVRVPTMRIGKARCGVKFEDERVGENAANGARDRYRRVPARCGSRAARSSRRIAVGWRPVSRRSPAALRPNSGRGRRLAAQAAGGMPCAEAQSPRRSTELRRPVKIKEATTLHRRVAALINAPVDEHANPLRSAPTPRFARNGKSLWRGGRSTAAA